MEDITLFFWIGGLIALLVQYYVRASPIFFIGELFGVGGLVCTLQEVENEVITGQSGTFMAIAMIVVILYSTVNLINHFWPTKNGGWKQ